MAHRLLLEALVLVYVHCSASLDWRRQPYNVTNFENQHSPYPHPYEQRYLYSPPYHRQPPGYEYFNNLVQRKRRIHSNGRGGNDVNDFGNNVNDFGNNVNDFGNNVNDFGNHVNDIGHNVNDFGNNVKDFGNNVKDFGNNVKDFGSKLNDEDYDDPLLVAYSHNPYADSVKSADFKREAIARTTERSLRPAGQETRGKRGVLHLYNMISCATSCDPISYKGYGCYCGFLGSGTPLDGIDSCCRSHDKCYERLFCPFFTVYLQPYFWRCHRGRPLCALENLDTRSQFVHGCAAQLCECDRRLAMCLREYSCPRRPALCTSSPFRLLQNLIMIR